MKNENLHRRKLKKTCHSLSCSIGKKIHYLNSQIFWCDSMKYLLINKNIKIFIPGNNILKLIHRILYKNLLLYFYHATFVLSSLHTAFSTVLCYTALYRFFLYIYFSWAGARTNFPSDVISKNVVCVEYKFYNNNKKTESVKA